MSKAEKPQKKTRKLSPHAMLKKELKRLEVEEKVLADQWDIVSRSRTVGKAREEKNKLDLTLLSTRLEIKRIAAELQKF